MRNHLLRVQQPTTSSNSVPTTRDVAHHPRYLHTPAEHGAVRVQQSAHIRVHGHAMVH